MFLTSLSSFIISSLLASSFGNMLSVTNNMINNNDILHSFYHEKTTNSSRLYTKCNFTFSGKLKSVYLLPTGEPKKFDPNFKGPMANRSVLLVAVWKIKLVRFFTTFQLEFR